MSQENKTPKFNIQNDKGDAPRKGPKFNIYWLYAVVAIVLLSAQFWKLAPDLFKSTEQEFKQKMLIVGDVERLDLITNKNVVRVYIKPDSVSKEFYVQKFSKALTKEKAKGVPLF